LVAFFEHPEEEIALQEPLIRDTVKRAVRLIGWMETPEVRPYYCEGLLHLHGMFDSGVLAFDGERLAVDVSAPRQEQLKIWYRATYRSLAKHYLQKEDAADFLGRYLESDGSRYLPRSLECRAFVLHFWERFQAIGQVEDATDSPKNWEARSL